MFMRQQRFASTLAMLSLLVIAAPLLAQAPQQVVTVEGITEYRLDNGMKVLLFPDASRPRVTVNLTVFVGSRHEGYGETGMAHLLEHMLFKGTPTHPDIPKVLQDRGAQFNGSTWVDRTNYYETLPAGDENLEFALRLEADRMVNSSIKGEDLASEMTVVRNEFESGENSPYYILIQRMTAVAFEWHNYGKSTIGNRSDIERVPIQNLRAFYRTYYQPDNAMLILAGQFHEQQALQYIQKYFGSIPRPQRKLRSTYTEEPAQDGQRSVSLRRVGDVGLVGLAYHIPAGAHSEYAAVRVLSGVLTMEPAGRLYKGLVETKKAASVDASAYAWHDPGLLMLLAEVRKEGSLDDVRSTLIELTEGLSDEGIEDDEVQRVKRRILSQRERSLADTSRLAIELSEWASQGDWRLFFIYRDRIQDVTAEQVEQVAAKYLTPSNRTVGIYSPAETPERTTIPPTPVIADLVRDYRGGQTVAEGEAFDPTPENVEARTSRDTLPEGIQVALLPKKTRAEAVRLRLTLRYGNQGNLKGLESAAAILPTLMTRGTKTLSRQEIQDELDKHLARLSASGQRGYASFSVETKRPHLPAVLGLLHKILREPTLPVDEFEIIRRERLASFEQNLTDPMTLASRELRRILWPYKKEDVRYIPTLDETIEWIHSATHDQVETIYHDLLGSSAGELAIVGDFDPGEIRPLLFDMLSSWPSKSHYVRIADTPFTDVPSQQQTILTPDKANAGYFAGLTIPIGDDHPDYPALVIGNFVLGGGSLSSRLGNRVRQQEGLSYGVRSMLSGDSLDPYAEFMIYAISNPQNSPKVVEVIAEELQRWLRDGITEEELQRAKSGYLESRQVGRSDDGRLVGTLADTLYCGRTMQFYAEFESRIRALTAAEVNSALRKHIDPKRLVVVTAGDFAGDKSESSGGR